MIRHKVLSGVSVAIAAWFALLDPAAAATRINVAVTQTLSNYSPYADSHAVGYAIACQTFGCLGTHNRGGYAGMLAESWETPDPNDWIFHLRQDVKWDDGTPVTADDVVHSYHRVMDDPQSPQRSNLSKIDRIEIIDAHTVKFVTTEPTSTLLDYIFGRMIITSKSVFDKYGAKIADRDHPVGFGPYRIKEIGLDEYIVLDKVPGNRWTKPGNPDEVIFRIMREPEQRVTALLNGEIQIAQNILPNLAQRVKDSATVHLGIAPSVEVNFLAMRPKDKPWDNKKLRQAVAYAIDRDAIIKSLLLGYADRLDQPVGPGQVGYQPDMEPRYSYDPDKARALVKEAGFPNGVSVDFYTPVGRYMNDKQTSEAITGMLRAVGINAQLKTPEWPSLWSDIQRGRAPFFYMGRGEVNDAGAMLSQYLESGVSPRVGYANPDLDALLRQERATFDHEQRMQVLAKAFDLIYEEVPVFYLWRMKTIVGIANSIAYEADAQGAVAPTDIVVKN
jgi:peptide/nickel transport system substrate-binding protein